MKIRIPAHIGLLFPLFLFFTLPAAEAQPFAGGSVGVSYTLHPGAALMKDQGYVIEQNGTPFSAEAGWKFELSADPVTFALSAGIRAGSQHVETMTPDSANISGTEFALTTIPVRAFARVGAGYFFLEACAGVHLSDITYKTDTGDFSGDRTDFSAGLSLGTEVIFLNRLAVRAGPQADYFYVGDTGAGKAVHMISVGGFAGVAILF